MAKNLFTGRLNGKRPRSRSRQRWVDRVETDLTEISEGIRIDDSEDSDRSDRWRGVVEEAMVLNGLLKLRKKKKKIYS